MCSARASAGTISPSSLLPPLIPPSLSPRYIPGVSLHVFPRASLPRPPASRKTRFARNASDEIISIRQVHQFGIEKVKSRRIGKSRYDLRALPRHISRLRGVLRCPPSPPPTHLSKFVLRISRGFRGLRRSYPLHETAPFSSHLRDEQPRADRNSVGIEMRYELFEARSKVDRPERAGG